MGDGIVLKRHVGSSMQVVGVCLGLLCVWVLPEGGWLVHGDLKTGGGVQSREVQS